MSKSRNINPNYKRTQRMDFSVEDVISGLKSSKKILSYAISKAESSLSVDKQFVDRILEHYTENPAIRRIAVTGPPGVGKSSFGDVFGSYLVEQNQKVAILPIDPSSHISKGSILGDKTRMMTFSRLENGYAKPMSSSLSLGGIAPSTYIASLLCEMAGYDYILIETVGVGQSEYAVKHIIDMMILLLQPAGGDDLQGIKRGIMELADLMIVTKADGELLPKVKQSIQQYKSALRLFNSNAYQWTPKISSYSIFNPDNDKVLDSINRYFDHMHLNDNIIKLRQDQGLEFFKAEAKNILMDKLFKNNKTSAKFYSILDKVKKAELLPIHGLRQLQED